MNLGIGKFGFTALTMTVLALSGGIASAKNVTVTEVGGKGMSVSGELLSYDGEVYNVRTSLGDLTLEVVGSICAGNACPTSEEEPEAVSVTVADSINFGQLPQITETN